METKVVNNYMNKKNRQILQLNDAKLNTLLIPATKKQSNILIKWNSKSTNSIIQSIREIRVIRNSISPGF